MNDESIQLDLTTSISEVPQANNLSLFVRLMEAVQRGTTEIEGLAEELAVEERTVHYYVDFGRWLQMLDAPPRSNVSLTETGDAFAGSVPARGRLFSQAMFARKLVQMVNALKRESVNSDEVETLSTRDACFKAIRGMTDLSDSTAKRRAQGLAHMLDAAYKPSRIDWDTGRESDAYRRIRFDFRGRTFLTAMAVRQFGTAKEFRVGFPRQVRAYVEGHGQGVSAKIFDRASFDTADGSASWFGPVPIDATTIEVAERGGRDLRKLLVTCAPYVTLAVALLTYRDAADRRSVRLTRDMYGLRFWDHERELGSPVDVVEKLAEALDLVPTKGVPAALTRADADLIEPGDDTDLVETLLQVGILRSKDTTFEVAPGFEDELRESGESSASIRERLDPFHETLRPLLVRW